MLADEYTDRLLSAGNCCDNFEFLDNGSTMSLLDKYGNPLSAVKADTFLTEIENIDYQSYYNDYIGYKAPEYGGKYYSPKSLIEKAYVPPFVKMSSLLIVKEEKIPTPYEFLDFILKTEFYVSGEDKFGQLIQLKDWATSNKAERAGSYLPSDRTIRPESIACRVLNAYPGLMREPALIRRLITSSLWADYNMDFSRNTSADINQDADIVCIYNDKRILISTYDDTPRGRQKRDEKIRNRAKKDIDCYSHINVATRLSFMGDKSNTEVTDGGLELLDWETVDAILLKIKSEESGEIILE